MIRAIFISTWMILVNFLISMNLYATATWIVPPTPIPNSSITTGASGVYTSISPSGKALVTWPDDNGNPYYATYDGANWSTPQAIPNYSGITFNYVLSAVNASGDFIISWQEISPSLDIYSTTYDGTNWTIPQPVPSSGFSGEGIISASAGGLAGDFMLAWGNNSDNYLPYYAIFNGTTEIVSAQSVAETNIQAYAGSFTAAFSPGNFMVTWRYATQAYYAIYNGVTWTGPFLIANSASPVAEVFCSAGPSGHFMASWYEVGRFPYYAIYDGTNWTTPQQVPSSTSMGAAIVSSSANSSGYYMTNWVGSGGAPYYAIYNGTNWTIPQVIDGTSILSSLNIFSAAFPIGNFMVTWLDGTGNPYYAIYGQPVSANFNITPSAGSTGTNFAFNSTVSGGTGVYTYAWNFGDGIGTSTASNPHYTYTTQGSYTVTLTVTDGSGGTSSPHNTISVAKLQLPPQNLKGKQKKDSDAASFERFNSLSWNEDSGVARYYLYRNGFLIATLEGNTTSYKDHNQPKTKQTYLLVAENAQGSEASSTITVGAR